MPIALDPILDPARTEKIIKAAKADPVSFAFGLGATPDTSVMAVDKSKAGKALLDICRKDSGAKKGAYGMVRFADGTAVLNSERDDTPQLAKAVLAYFKANKINLKVKLEDERATAEDEDEDEDEVPRPAKGETGKEAEAEAEEDEDVPEGRIFDPATIVPLIRKAKNKPRPFAFGIGPDLALPLLAVHTKLDPTRLAKMVRAEGAKKGVWGMMTLEGSVAVFTCEKAPFSGVKMQIRQWFAERKLALKVRVVGPDGDFEDPADMEAAEGSAPEDGLKGIRTGMDALLPRLKEMAQQVSMRTAIREQWQKAETALKAGNAEAARVALDALRDIASPKRNASPSGAWSDALATAQQAWAAATADAEAQLSALGRTLRRHRDEDLDYVADTGLNGVRDILEKHTRPISDLLAAAPGEGSRFVDTVPMIQKAITVFRRELDGNQKIEACDRNPFGVKVELRSLFEAALASLDQACAPAT